ncbi:MAG: acylphosphatase [Candidatus Bathyarchaeota archaeon]|nr:acylphosphatase [Candidatus Bathyarchaeum sp.]
MNVRAHIFVSGRVQGVFFRVETRHEAMKRNVTGWIRNTSDGKVEAIFEGEKENVDGLIDFCRNGPPEARVTQLDIQWEEYTGDFNNFKIRKAVII